MSRDRPRIIVLAAATLLFVFLGISLRRHALFTTDRAVAQWFEAHITPTRTSFAFAITQAGSDVFTFGLAAVAAFRLRRRSRYWYQRLLVTLVGGVVSNEVLKFIFYRQRPQFNHPLLHLYSNSFPSGHTLAATVLYGMLMIIACSLSKSTATRIAVVAAGLAMIVLVAASRIYLGVHYFSDVIGGFLEGLIWINGVALLMDRKQGRVLDSPRFRIAG